jgi:hypothetical protein
MRNVRQLLVGDAQVLVRAVIEIVIGILRQVGVPWMIEKKAVKNTSLFNTFQCIPVADCLLLPGPGLSKQPRQAGKMLLVVAAQAVSERAERHRPP